MLKQSLAFLLLICHVNFFMFVAQVDEVDAFDSHGCRINDVNSLVEYINDVLLDNNGKSRPDEDDDTARYFHLNKLNVFSSVKPVIESEHSSGGVKSKETFPPYNSRKLLSVFFDVVTPPPRFMS